MTASYDRDKFRGMATGKKEASGTRSVQKCFTFNAARKPFEDWCDANGYDQNQVALAGWLLVQSLTHEQRMAWFTKVKEAVTREWKPESGGSAASAAPASQRPAEKTPSQGSRRAG